MDISGEITVGIEEESDFNPRGEITLQDGEYEFTDHGLWMKIQENLLTWALVPWHRIFVVTHEREDVLAAGATIPPVKQKGSRVW